MALVAATVRLLFGEQLAGAAELAFRPDPGLQAAVQQARTTVERSVAECWPGDADGVYSPDEARFVADALRPASSAAARDRGSPCVHRSRALRVDA